jgi:glycosyltransferase involved in cell wall biosynthesis
VSNNFKSISFITPCLNEEKNIENLIKSIKKAVLTIDHEIIVVDNGSSDETVRTANDLDAKTIIAPNVTIATLRNIGASHAVGDLLIFIDADITLPSDWLVHLKNSSDNWPDNNLLITGSKVEIAPNASRLERAWFSKLKKDKNTYVNSGHMITNRKSFNLVSGFNENLRTGEDHDICQRATKEGIKVFNDPSIVAFHHDYPKRIIDFVRREIWHGLEDYKSVNRFVKSKTATLSLINTINVIILIILLLNKSIFFYLPIIIIFILTTFSMIIKIEQPFKLKTFFYQAFIMQVYFLSRTISITKITSSRRLPKK